MTRELQMMLTLLVCIGLTFSSSSCAAGARVPPSRAQDRSKDASGRMHSDLESDSQAVARYLKRRGYELNRIVAHRDQYHAVFAVAPTTRSKQLITLEAAADSFQFVGEPQDVGDLFPDSVRFFSMGGQSVDGLLVTFDNRLEGLVGTVLYALSNGRLRIIFRDGPDACAPAELRDLDGDLSPELVSHVDDPSDADCGDPCHLDLWQRFRVAPGWVRIQRWDGQQWVSVEREHASYYRDLADVYERVARWVTTGSGNERCRAAKWTQEGQVFSGWAARARALSAGR